MNHEEYIDFMEKILKKFERTGELTEEERLLATWSIPFYLNDPEAKADPKVNAYMEKLYTYLKQKTYEAMQHE